MRRLTEARVDKLREQLQQLPIRHCPENDPPELQTARALLILDNVDQPELLSAVQRALLPAEEWLEVIVTTRLDPASFGGDDRTFQAVEVSVLPEADAVRLLADFQPAHRFANESEEAAAHEIAHYLGGYTLAVELVAAYLGSRAADGYEPSHYLPQLQAAGLTHVDDLADEAGLKGQIRHSDDVAQNHIGTLIGWSLERLSPPARTALEFASLLMPDEIPLAWLKDLSMSRHSDELAEDPSQSPPWQAVWRELSGLRLLGLAEELELDERGLEQIPEAVRIHRLVAQHVVTLCPDGEAKRSELYAFLDHFTTLFEQQVGQTDDGWLRAQHPWLRDQLEHLIEAPSPTSTLLSSAGVIAGYEGEHGLLARAITFTTNILSAKEQLLRDNPHSARAARDVSVSLDRLADFLARRGQSGDADQAFGFYERSLKVREQLLSDNAQSAQASRDVSVSLNKLADFLARRGQPSDAAQAFRFYQRCLDTNEQLLRDNPQSAIANRDVLVLLERIARVKAGRVNGAAKALELQTRSLEIELYLREANASSYFHQRTAAVSFYLTAQYANAASVPTQANECLEGCYSILHSLVENGFQLDPAMQQRYDQLTPMF